METRILRNPDTVPEALRALARRTAGPRYAEKLEFALQEEPGAPDSFTVQDEGDRIRIRGTSGPAAAAGLHWYLRNRCGYTVGPLFTWGSLPEVPPAVGEPFTGESPFRQRYFFNYCTFGYSLAYSGKKQWERLLDWLILSGCNLALNPLGQEWVWEQVLTRLGYSPREARQFAPGPAFMPWFLMGNLSGYRSDGPDWLTEDRRDLAVWFQNRLESFGISLVWPGYGGMVPDDFGTRFPESSPCLQGKWCGFRRPACLLPGDPMFQRVGSLFYDELRKLRGGKDAVYFSCDPFHEGSLPPGTDLGALAAGIYGLMARENPGAVWCFQGWQENPRRQLLGALAPENTLVMNLMSDRCPDGGDDFLGHPWIYGTVNNFGGQHVLRGSISRSLAGPYEALKTSRGFCGIGMLPEAVETDEVFFDIFSEIGFRTGALPEEDYLRDFITRRYGFFRPELLEAWLTLSDRVYGRDVPDGGDESPFCSRPSLTVDSASTWGGHSRLKDPEPLIRVVSALCSAYPQGKASEAFCYDLVDLTRQLLANETWRAVYALQEAWGRGDTGAAQRLGDCILRRFDLMYALLKTHRSFLLGPRIAEARERGRTPEEKRWFEVDFRTLITLWADREGDELHDYAAREYAEMIRDFYKPRWEQFLSRMEEGFVTGCTPDRGSAYDRESGFLYARTSCLPGPSGSPLEAAADILQEVRRWQGAYGCPEKK